MLRSVLGRSRTRRADPSPVTARVAGRPLPRRSANHVPRSSRRYRLRSSDDGHAFGLGSCQSRSVLATPRGPRRRHEPNKPHAPSASRGPHTSPVPRHEFKPFIAWPGSYPMPCAA